jgi:hypothetical protein
VAVGLAGDGEQEALAAERAQLGRFECEHGRRSRDVAQQRDLAEGPAGLQAPAWLTVHAHLDGARFHKEERVALLALNDDRLTR